MAKRRAAEHEMTATEFESLSDSEKERIFAELEAESPAQRDARSTPLTPVMRERYRKFRSRLRASDAKRATQTISVSVDGNLLKKADAYAKRNHLNRSELFSRSLKTLLGIAS